MAGKKDPKKSKSSPDSIDPDQDAMAIAWSKIFKPHAGTERPWWLDYTQEELNDPGDELPYFSEVEEYRKLDALSAIIGKSGPAAYWRIGSGETKKVRNGPLTHLSYGRIGSDCCAITFTWEQIIQNATGFCLVSIAAADVEAFQRLDRAMTPLSAIFYRALVP